MSRQGKPLQFQMTEIDDLLDARYGSKRMFPLLALLYPGVDPREQFHEDHIFPRSILRSKTKLRAAKVPEPQLDQFIDLCDRVPNLQLLRGADNIGKSDTLPLDCRPPEHDGRAMSGAVARDATANADRARVVGGWMLLEERDRPWPAKLWSVVRGCVRH